MPIASNAVKVDGLANLHRALKSMSPAIEKEFRKDLRAIAKSVAESAQAQMPVRSGTARKSVRASTLGGGAAVREGGPNAPYVGWLDFGGTLAAQGGRTNMQHRPVFKEGRYLYPAVGRRRGDIVRAAEAAVRKAKRAAGFW